MTPTRIIAVLLILAAVIALLALLLILPGAEEPSADVASRLQAGRCAQPCWRGIQPGVTTLDEAETILREDEALEITREAERVCGQSSNPFWQLCAEAEAATVTRLNWILPASGDERVFLADTIAAFGEPFAAKLCGRLDTWHSVVVFNGNVVVIAYGGSALMNEPRRLAPDQRVEQVLYYAEGTMPPRYMQDAPPWRGYGEVAEHPICQI
jgi:hypothetical protein